MDSAQRAPQTPPRAERKEVKSDPSPSSVVQLMQEGVSPLMAPSSTAPIAFREPLRWVRIGGVFFPVQVHLPDGYTPRKKWPLILFLHGSGERGTDGVKQTQVGLGPVADRYPAIILFPQINHDMSWNAWGLRVALEALNMATQLFSVDASRVYLTGISMGASGAWSLAVQKPELFAAVVPVAAQRDPSPQTDSILIHTPIWIFHEKNDLICEVQSAQRMREFLRSIGHTHVLYTEYSNGVSEFDESYFDDCSLEEMHQRMGEAHRLTWERAYSEPGLVEWLFSQKRNKRSAVSLEF